MAVAAAGPWLAPWLAEAAAERRAATYDHMTAIHAKVQPRPTDWLSGLTRLTPAGWLADA
jgi:hypothetical protein